MCTVLTRRFSWAVFSSSGLSNVETPVSLLSGIAHQYSGCGGQRVTARRYNSKVYTENSEVNRSQRSIAKEYGENIVISVDEYSYEYH